MYLQKNLPSSLYSGCQQPVYYNISKLSADFQSSLQKVLKTGYQYEDDVCRPIRNIFKQLESIYQHVLTEIQTKAKDKKLNQNKMLENILGKLEDVSKYSSNEGNSQLINQDDYQTFEHYHLYAQKQYKSDSKIQQIRLQSIEQLQLPSSIVKQIHKFNLAQLANNLLQKNLGQNDNKIRFIENALCYFRQDICRNYFSCIVQIFQEIEDEIEEVSSMDLSFITPSDKSVQISKDYKIQKAYYITNVVADNYFYHFNQYSIIITHHLNSYQKQILKQINHQMRIL